MMSSSCLSVVFLTDHRLSTSRRVALAVTVLAVGAGAASAEPVTTVNLRQSLSVDDNQDLEPDSPGETFISRTGLDVVVNGGNNLLEWVLGGGADVSVATGSGEDGELDSINPRANVGVTFQRDTVSGTAGAFVRRRPISFVRNDVDNSVDISPDAPPPVIGGEIPPGLAEVTSANADQIDFGLNTGLNFALDRSSSLRFGLSAAGKRFTGASGATAGELIDSETFTATAGWVYAVDRRSSLSLGTDFSFFNSDNGVTDSSRTAGVSGSYSAQLTPRHSLNAGAGVKLIDTTLSPALTGGETSDTSVSFVGNLGLRYQLRDAAFDLNLSQSVEPSALGELQNRTSVVVGTSYQINQRFSLGASAGLTLQNAVSSATGDTDRQLVDMGLNLNYQPAAEWNVGIGYRLQVSDQEGEGTAVSNSAALTISRSLSFLN